MKNFKFLNESDVFFNMIEYDSNHRILYNFFFFMYPGFPLILSMFCTNKENLNYPLEFSHIQ